MVTSILGAGNDGQGSDTDLVKETTTAKFADDVIEMSKEAAVVLDFWAPWCGPCKQLTPILEKLVRQAKGAVRLVRVNIDEYPEIAQQMQVKSIPAVYAIKDGRPVDGFTGALPESQVKIFLERLIGADALGGMDVVLETAAMALEAGDVQDAVEVYGAILAEDRENSEAIAGLAKCYLKTNDLDRAEQTLALTPPDKKASAPIMSAEAMLALARKSGSIGDRATLQAKIEADANDHDARFDLAMVLYFEGDKEGALDALFEIMKRKRAWNDEAARKQLIEFFEAWGAADPFSIEGRRRLSSFLFS